MMCYPPSPDDYLWVILKYRWPPDFEIDRLWTRIVRAKLELDFPRLESLAKELMRHHVPVDPTWFNRLGNGSESLVISRERRTTLFVRNTARSGGGISGNCMWRMKTFRGFGITFYPTRRSRNSGRSLCPKGPYPTQTRSAFLRISGNARPATHSGRMSTLMGDGALNRR